MDDESGLARIAALLADAGRARILWALIDGTTRPAGELAFCARLSPQAASTHLAKLVAGGLLTREAQGRHRYFRIANADIADAIEGLAAVGAARPRPASVALPSGLMPAQFLHARSCYDHLAGEMAVRVLDGMVRAKWLHPEGRDYRLTRLGESRLGALGVDLDSVRRQRRVFARACVDLTQRRPHLSGALAAAMFELFQARGWILRARRSRVVTITPNGREALQRAFGAN